MPRFRSSLRVHGRIGGGKHRASRQWRGGGAGKASVAGRIGGRLHRTPAPRTLHRRGRHGTHQTPRYRCPCVGELVPWSSLPVSRSASPGMGPSATSPSRVAARTGRLLRWRFGAAAPSAASPPLVGGGGRKPCAGARSTWSTPAGHVMETGAWPYTIDRGGHAPESKNCAMMPASVASKGEGGGATEWAFGGGPSGADLGASDAAAAGARCAGGIGG